MKKRARKLSLSRETVRHLQDEHFRRIAGGGNTNEIQTGCACSDGCGGTGGCTGTCGCDTRDCPGNTYEILSGCATNCG